MSPIILLLLGSIVIVLLAVALARELRLRRAYERLLVQMLSHRRSRDAPLEKNLAADPARDGERVSA